MMLSKLFVGPAGSGKTHIVQYLSEESKTLFLKMTDNTTYDDIIEGIELITNTESAKYSLKEKSVLQFLYKAQKDHTNIYYLVLDDIQCIDMSYVFGDLLYALEHRNEVIRLKSGREIIVPKNIMVMATASTSDINKQLWRKSIAFFDEVIYLKNDEANYISALDGLRKINSMNVSDEQYNSIVDVLKEEYRLYTDRACKFLGEYSTEKQYFKIGFSYFLPSEETPVTKWIESIQHKIRNQVIPLLNKYAQDGIIDPQYIPNENNTDTNYVQESIAVEKINIEEEASGQYAEIEKDVFDKNLPLPVGVKFKANRSQTVNCLYIALFSLVRDIIESNVVPNDELVKLFITDTDVLTWRKDIKNSDTNSEGACLFILKDISDNFSVRDAAEGNSKGGYAYSKSYHIIKYKNKMYRMFSAYNIRNRKVKCPMLTTDCIENDIGIQKRDFYKTAKMLAYKYLLKAKEILERYIEYNGFDLRIDNIIRQLEIDIDIVSKITDDINYKGQENFIDLNGDNDVHRKEKAKDFIIFIKKLPSWEILKECEVQRIMDNKYMHVMNITDIHQMILQGPPGTSKTYGAKKFISDVIGIKGENWEEELIKYQLKTNQLGDYENIVGDKKVFWDIVQFHPSYTYEDFVRGINVYTIENKETIGTIKKQGSNDVYNITLNVGDSVGYKTVNKTIGKMAEFADAAMKNAIDENKEPPIFILLIDEINRANLATVFGELIYALEYRGRSIDTPYAISGSTKITLPKNLYIIGTMNSADKSIESIDYAIRRRFLFFKALPNISAIIKSIKKYNIETELKKSVEIKLFRLITMLFNETLNELEYDIEDIQIGHTYFLRKNSDDTLAEEEQKIRFIYQILPILKEYRKDGILNFQIKDFKNKIYSDVLTILVGMLDKNEHNQESDYEKILDSMNADTIEQDIEQYIDTELNGNG